MVYIVSQEIRNLSLNFHLIYIYIYIYVLISFYFLNSFLCLLLVTMYFYVSICCGTKEKRKTNEIS